MEICLSTKIKNENQINFFIGTANLLNCSDDLVFNPAKNTCDYSKYVAGCEDLTSSKT